MEKCSEGEENYFNRTVSLIGGRLKKIHSYIEVIVSSSYLVECKMLISIHSKEVHYFIVHHAMCMQLHFEIYFSFIY